MNVPLMLNVLIITRNGVSPIKLLIPVLSVLLILIVHQTSLSVPYLTMSVLLMVSTSLQARSEKKLDKELPQE